MPGFSNPEETPVPHPEGIADPAELDAFLTTFFTEKMEALHIPGLAFVLVRDGQVFFSKGYGYADLERGIPVDPERTLFRIASVTKLFTATAAMQLVEQGLLDLDVDINRYLTGFRIPDTYPQPITLVHLLTHTAGFDELDIGYFAVTEADVLPLGVFLAARMPPRIAPPGQVHTYCNYCLDLVGYIVEQVSGMPYAEYIDEYILRPLGINHTARAMLRQDPVSDHAIGYGYVGGAYEPVPFVFGPGGLNPAGGLSASVMDMARFMIAHLQDGQYEDGRILEVATAQEMHRQQFTHHPALLGWCYGFEENFINGRRVIGHGGGVRGFNSQMILLPEHNLGFFLAYNLRNETLIEDLIQAFFDRYYPAPDQAPPQFISLSPSDLNRFEGTYWGTRYSHTQATKLIALVTGSSIHANQDGSLSYSFVWWAGGESRYLPVEPLVFERVAGGTQSLLGVEVDPGDKLVFREDENGRITYGFIPLGNMAMEKVSWCESGYVQVGSLVVIFLVLFSAVVGWPLVGFVQRLRKRPADTGTRAHWLLGLTSTLNLVFMVTLAVSLFSLASQVSIGVPLWFQGLLVIPVVTGLLTLASLGVVALVWRYAYWSALGRVHYSLVVLANLGFILWVNYWNLLGWQF